MVLVDIVLSILLRAAKHERQMKVSETEAFCYSYPMPYKTIFIDWDGTLSKSRFWDRWNHDPEQYPRYTLIQDVLFNNDEGKLLILDWMRGLRSSANILQYLEDTTGIPYKELESELRYSSDNMTFINCSVIDKIQKIRAKGIKVVIATDNMDTFEHVTVPSLRLDELFDGVIISSNRGALKNEIIDNTSQFFNLYIQQNGLQLHDSVLIDDNLDTKVVETLGIDFLHVNSRDDLSGHLDDLLSLVKG